MNKSLSVYLEALRWTAALGVFASHFTNIVAPVFLSPATSLGRECVAAFFVLSGFVIRFVSLEKERNWREYAGARMARMYSVLFLALFATVAADQIGLFVNPAAYWHQGWFHPNTSLLSLASYLTFTGELWFRHSYFGSNEPYWSLGFEVPYYVLFGLAIYARPRWRTALIVAWAMLVGPKIVAYLPLWLMGVVAYDVIAGKRLDLAHPRAVGSALFIGSVALFVFDWRVLQPQTFIHMFMQGPWRDAAWSWGYFMLMGVAVTANIIGFALLAKAGLRWNAKLAAAIRWLAGGSFSLYLTHQPLLAMAHAFFPAANGNAFLAAAVALGVLALTLALAELGERRKVFYKRVFSLLLAGVPTARVVEKA